MDWFPLLNSIRISLIATAMVLIVGTALAYWTTRAPRWFQVAMDLALTLPLVLPPTVVGFFLLRAMGSNSYLGQFLEQHFNYRLVLTWPASVIATFIVSLPLLYRTARGAFEAMDPNLRAAGQTLGLSNTRIFFRILLPACRSGLLAGTVLSFARALGEYGATSMVSGYIPGRTATISTAVYQFWRIGQESLAYRWVWINLGLSAVLLILLHLYEGRLSRQSRQQGGRLDDRSRV